MQITHSIRGRLHRYLSALCALSLLGVFGTAQADQICFNWTRPTVDTFGKPQDPAQITGYRLFYSKDRSAVPNNYKDVSGTLTTYCVTGLEAGDYYAQIQTLAGSESSAVSNMATGHTIAETTPVPPPASTDQLCITKNGMQVGCVNAPPNYPNIIATLDGTWSLRIGTSNVSTGHVSEDACRKAGNDRATTTSVDYSCVPVGRKFTVRKQ